MRTLDMNKNIENNNMPAPKLRFPGYTGVWEEKALGEVGTFVRGLSYNKGEVTQDSKFTLVLRSNNIVQDAAVDCKNGLQFVTKGPSSEQILRKGDIVICLSNGSSNLVGKSASYEGDYDGVVTVGAFCGIYRSTAPITKYLVQTPAYKKSIDLIKQGGNGALANLYGRDILGLRFYFPSLEEQKRIVECLEAEDLMIAAQEQKVESLRANKKGLMQRLFPQPGETTPRLRFPGFTGEWEEKTFSDLCNTVTPPLKLQSRDYLKDGKFPIVDQSQDLICGWTNDESGVISDNPVIIFGDHTCVLKFIAFPFVQGADGVKILKTLEGYWPQFVFQSFLANPVNPDGYKRHFSDLKEKSFMFPQTPSEQKTIADCLATLDSIIAAETKKLESLKTHKRGLMQQMFPQPNK